MRSKQQNVPHDEAHFAVCISPVIERFTFAWLITAGVLGLLLVQQVVELEATETLLFEAMTSKSGSV
jgi:hypothetical protein